MPKPLSQLFVKFLAARNYFLLLLSIAAAYSCPAQSDFFSDVAQEFIETSDLLLPYEDIRMQWTMDGRIQANLNEGINYLFEQNPSIAESSFNKVLEQDSGIWQARYYRAICRKQAGSYAAAIDDFTRVLATNNATYECNLELGKTHQLNKDLRQAARHYDKAAKADPSRATTYFLRGNLYLDQMQPRMATRQYNACLSRDSSFHAARIRLAFVDMVSDGEATAALPHLDRVLSQDPAYRTALLLRGLIRFEDDPTASLIDLETLVRVNPTNLMAIYLRGLQQSVAGNYARAFADFHKVIDATAEDDNQFKGKQTWIDKRIDIQNVGTYAVTRVYGLPEVDGKIIKKAFCQLVMMQYDLCIQSIDSTSIFNSEPLCLYIKAVAFEHNSRHTDALNFYNRALNLDNDILDAHKKRAIYEQELKQYDSSVKDLTEVLRINPEAWIAYKIRGISHFYNGAWQSAIDDYTQYLAHDSADLEIRSYRGLAHRKAGHGLEAAVDFARANHADVIPPGELTQSLDSLLIIVGDTTRCMQYLDVFTEYMPDFTEGHAMRLRILASRNEWTKIERSVDRAIIYLRHDAPSEDRSYLLTMKAMVLGREKQYDTALAKLNLAITTDKFNSLAFLERGKLWLARGKTSKAIDDLRKAASLGHPDADALLRKISS
jgi:tetratricopeptide (TPR) repeat protein